MQTAGITFINDKDIYTAFGASLIGESFQNLLIRPDRKEGAENNMISHPGVQTFNDNIQPEAREVELTFLVRGNSLDDFLTKFNALQDEIDNEKGDANFNLRVVPLHTTYKLRRKSCLSLDSFSDGSEGKLIITARELNPKDRIIL